MSSCVGIYETSTWYGNWEKVIIAIYWGEFVENHQVENSRPDMHVLNEVK